jgi:hypothetical protein
MELTSKYTTYFLWMGDMWGSAIDNVKGHDFQYWSSPLEFDEEGNILPLEWVDSWSVHYQDNKD